MDGVHQQLQCNLSILHFNDVYDVQPQANEPKGGAAYFKTLLDQYRKPHTLTLFSGDAFSPALLSSEHQGQNMIKPLNSFKIDLACMGNHDFDYPLDHVKILKDQTNFPWLLSNVHDKFTGKRLCDCEQYQIINKNGYKIGIFSLAQRQWIDTLIPSYKDILEYIPWEEFTDYMVKQLKSEGCNLIIALTHMMRYNDAKLAQKFPQIDLILGGHDHLVVHEKINNSILVKSGTNFKSFSLLQIYPAGAKQKLEKGEAKPHQQKFIFSNQNISVRVTLVQVNHAKTLVQPDPQLHEYIEEIYSHFRQRQQKIGCYFLEDVDLRFRSIRKQQNAYLQFLVSLYRHYTKAQCALMNSGNFRADTYIPVGPVTYGVLTNIIQDEIVVKKVKGDRLLMGLENCVSMYPNLSGRYSTFSGIQFTWDCSRKPFERILPHTVRIGGKPLRLQKIYRVAMHGFVSQGGDGFIAFKDCQIDHGHFHQSNLLLINDLLAGSQKLLTGFPQKYPGRISYQVNQDGRKMLILHVPNPKNVKMIGEKVEENKEQDKKPQSPQTIPIRVIEAEKKQDKILPEQNKPQQKVEQQIAKLIEQKLKVVQNHISPTKSIETAENFKSDELKKALLRKQIEEALEEQERKNSSNSIEKSD